MDKLSDNRDTVNQNGGKKGTRLVKKPSINRKPPEVKQTLTSKYRLLKANPLLKWNMDGKSLDTLPISFINSTLSFKKTDDLGVDLSVKETIQQSGSLLKSKDTTVDKCSKINAPNKVNVKDNTRTKQTIVRSQSVKSSTENKFKKPTPKPTSNYLKQTTSSQNRYTPKLPTKSTINSKTNGVNKMQKSTVPSSRDKVNSWLAQNSVNKPNKDNSESKQNNREDKQHNVAKATSKQVIRRSLSAQHLERKKTISQSDQPSMDRSITKSFEDLRPSNGKRVMLLTTNISPIVEERLSVSFKSPSAYERRSIIFKTPKTPNTSHRSLYRSFCEPPEAATQDLQHKLNDWLKGRGKSIGSFHHLKCFGLHHLKKVIDDENKENIEVLQDLRKGSYEDLQILDTKGNDCDTRQTEDEKKPVEESLNVIANEALGDLHKLILEGYPHHQCEAWLKLMYQKYKNLEQEPQYWECRAAIEEGRGNISSAVECYKTAIVQGAEVHSVDESLEQLLQKFSLLNISTSENENRGSTRERARIVKDARNVFKSTIIQFAVQERTLKKQNASSKADDKKFIVTPVRRSTRSRRSSAYTSTPGMKICTTLQDLEASVRQSMDFYPNNALC